MPPSSTVQNATAKQETDRTGYSSPKIVARRHRILSETRKIISENGIAGVAMEDVAQRAGVAKRTIYNAFQSKERMVAAAIQQYFEEYASRLTYHSEEATLERIIERLAVVARRNQKIRNYSRALMNIYYSHDVDTEIRDAIHDIAAQSHEPWIRALASKRQLQPWIDADELISTLVGLRYSIAFAWAEGRIGDDDFIRMLIESVMTHMAGATRGAARREIERRLANLDEDPLLTES